jgi:hypothetical protein
MNRIADRIGIFSKRRPEASTVRVSGGGEGDAMRGVGASEEVRQVACELANALQRNPFVTSTCKPNWVR